MGADILFTQKQMIIMTTLQNLLKLYFILQIMNQIYLHLQKKNKNVIELIIGKFGGKILTESAVLRPKTYSYLMELLKFEHDKNCSEPTQLKNKMNHLEKKRIEIMQSWIK